MAETLERRGEQTYRASEAARLLAVSRATFYRIAWFKSRRVRLTTRRVGYLASDIALYQALRRGL